MTSSSISAARSYNPKHDAVMDGATPPGRIHSIDVIRGAVMLLMAIDHVRVFAGVPPGGPSPGVFFTRWITHFCAPTFVLLAGASAFFQGESRDRRQLAQQLVTRGAILVLLELTILRFGWTFNFDYSHYILAGVIWSIGWSMILLSGLIFLPRVGLATLSLGVIALHNLLDPLVRNPAPLRDSSLAWLWQVLYFGGPVQLGSGGPVLSVLYSIVPWVAVMGAGYAFGPVLRKDARARDRICLLVGGLAILLFVFLRGGDIYGDPRPWHAGPPGAPPLIAIINTTKYPASFAFLLMTLGPVIFFLPLIERARGRVAEVVATYGRVPMFYYVLHIPLIHALAVVVSIMRTGSVAPWLFANHPMMMPPAPAGYMYSLPLLYLLTLIAVTILYFPCRWYARFKSAHPGGLVRFL